MYIGLTGVRLGAHDLKFAGLATHALPSSQLAQLTARLETGADAGAVLAELEASHPLEGQAVLPARSDAIERAFGAHHASVEAVVEALGREGEWGAQTLKLLAKSSPTSLKLTHRLLRAHADVTVKAALETEFTVVQRCLRPGGDFYEGIRSVLVDKGKGPPPAWKPASLAQVTPSMIDAFFAPLEGPNRLRL